MQVSSKFQMINWVHLILIKKQEDNRIIHKFFLNYFIELSKIINEKSKIINFRKHSVYNWLFFKFLLLHTSTLVSKSLKYQCCECDHCYLYIFYIHVMFLFSYVIKLIIKWFWIFLFWICETYSFDSNFIRKYIKWRVKWIHTLNSKNCHEI